MTNPDSHPFAQFVRILGRGKTGTRSLELDEAREAFGMILRGEVEDLQLGAFLMLLRVKEESPEELAGFVQASREAMLQPPGTPAPISCFTISTSHPSLPRRSKACALRRKGCARGPPFKVS